MRTHLIAAAILLVLDACVAQIRLPAVIGDGMVLQRDTAAPLWGWAQPGATVRVEGSWDRSRAATATADAEGAWAVRIKTPGSGGPHTVTIAGGDVVTVKDVLIGEVWLCSGQSNMEMPLGDFGGGYTGVRNSEQEIEAANFPKMRFFNVTNATSMVPRRDCAGSWAACSPESARGFSATAYFFGRGLFEDLGVPIGLIEADWGGTVCEAWTSERGLSTLPDFASATAALADARTAPLASAAASQKAVPQNTAGALWNGMIAPLVPYAIRGAIWYQGESNRTRARQYQSLFPAMIADWRRAFDRGEFPFFFVQIAPFSYGKNVGAAAALREAQLLTLRVPNTGMVVTTDIGDAKDIHPSEKREVGRRLALWALAKTYGKTDRVCSGPLYRSMTVEGDASDPRIRIAFDHAGEGLVVRGPALTCFEAAGADRKFVAATATIDGATVVVRCAGVRPVAVRFAWSDAPEPNLFNAAGLPASPFRTDDW